MRKFSDIWEATKNILQSLCLTLVSNFNNFNINPDLESFLSHNVNIKTDISLQLSHLSCSFQLEQL